MNTLEAIQTRRSVHSFLDIPVEWEKVGNLIVGAHYAPNAGNVQSWRFLVVTERKVRRQIAESCLKQYWMEEAPVHIIICSDPGEMKRHYDERGVLYDTQSAAAAAENMLLIAQEEGLSGSWVGAFEEEMLKKACDIPKEITPHMVLVFGYSDEKPPVPEKFHISDITYINSWGNKIANMDIVLQNWSDAVRSKAMEAREASLKQGRKLHTKVLMKMRRHAESIDKKFQKAKAEMETRRKIKKAKKAFEKEKKRKR